MTTHGRSAALLVLALAACAVPDGGQLEGLDDILAKPPVRQRVQGLAGVTRLSTFAIEPDPGVGTTETDESTNLLTGGGQLQFPKHIGELELGLETGFSIGWTGSADVVRFDTGSVEVDADTDLLVFDLSAGVYASHRLAERLRVYAGAGPLLQFAGLDLDYEPSPGDTETISEEGIGLGTYARAGLELAVGPRSAVGLVARWSDVTLDMSGELEELRLEGIQWMLSLTTSF